ncbi:MAG: tetratricopeptide repeat protein, partial [Chloroflexota bacterium]
FVGGKLKVNGTTPLAFKVQLYQLNVALQQHPCLIVIDGLQTAADLSDALAVINQLPPPTRVLFTSRLAPSVEALENIDVVPILELNAADAQTLLQMRNPALTADHCQAVYEQLGGHPETLQLLATYSRKWPIHRILTAFEQAQEGMIERHFDTIYAEIWASLSADTQRLLQTLCFVAATGVSEEMLRVAGSFSDAQIWTAVEEADQFGLLVAHGSPDTFWYSIHHLTRQFVRSHSALLHENALAVMQYWQHRFEVLAPAEWHLLEHDRHNLFQAVQFSLELADDHPDLQQMVYKLAGLLYRFVGQRGFGNQWLPIHEALTVVSWLDERQRAVRLNQLGSLYREQQQFDVAIFTHKQAAQHAEAVSDAQLLARVDYNIAIAHRRAARYAEAAHYAEAAFRRFTHSQPEEAMRIFNLLGTISRHQGAFEEAKGYFQKSLDQLSSDVSDLVHGRILINLGNVLREQGAFLEARQQLSKAETLLPAVPTTLHYTLWLAQVRLLMAQGETEQALALLERFDIKQLQQAGLYLYSGLALHNRAEAFVLQGYFGKGETAVRQAADIWRLLEDNGRLATSLKVLGDTFFERRRSKQAAQIYEEVRTLARPYSKDYYLQGMIKEIEMKLDLLLRGDNGG